MKNVKLMGNYELFFMIVSLAVALVILFFDYSITVEIKTHFQSSVSKYVVPLWMSVISAICINLIGGIMALIFMKGLKEMVKFNKQQAQRQSLNQH